MNVVFEDNHLLVVDKPAGLRVQGGDRRGSGDDNGEHLVARAAAWLKDKYDKPGNAYVGLVHRLDRNTSGVVVLAKTSKAAARLSRAFASRAVRKDYLALVAGDTPDAGTLEHLVAPTTDHGTRIAGPTEREARRARLSYQTLARSPGAVGSPGASCLLVRLETGRKHQIRVQLAAAGHPLLGDRRYAPPDTAARFHRPALHAWTIALIHPVRKEELTAVAPLPADLTRLLDELGMAVTDPQKNTT